jgi:hypothetical protein
MASRSASGAETTSQLNRRPDNSFAPLDRDDDQQIIGRRTFGRPATVPLRRRAFVGGFLRITAAPLDARRGRKGALASRQDGARGESQGMGYRDPVDPGHMR